MMQVLMSAATFCCGTTTFSYAITALKITQHRDAAIQSRKNPLRQFSSNVCPRRLRNSPIGCQERNGLVGVGLRVTPSAGTMAVTYDVISRVEKARVRKALQGLSPDDLHDRAQFWRLTAACLAAFWGLMAYAIASVL
jgi:hypothetical protein